MFNFVFLRKPVMQCGRSTCTDRKGGSEHEKWDPSTSTSTPDLCVQRPRSSRAKPAERDRDSETRERPLRRTPRDGHSASDTNVSARQNDLAAEDSFRIEAKLTAGGDKIPSQETMQRDPTSPQPNSSARNQCAPARKTFRQDVKIMKCNVKRSKSNAANLLSPLPMDVDFPVMRQLREIHNDMRASARIIKDSRTRLVLMQKKSHLSVLDVKELTDRHELLLREMERFDRLTRNVQQLVDYEVASSRQFRGCTGANPVSVPNPGYEPVMFHEMKMPHPTVALGRMCLPRCSTAPGHPSSLVHDDATHSKSEIDLTRKLNESYDMQEKLVADNADLEVKRYILYKELMTKDQNLETCRTQIKRLQGELKLMSKENSVLHEKIARNCPEGDAASLQHGPTSKNELKKEKSDLNSKQLVLNLEGDHKSTLQIENQLRELELEVRVLREDMDKKKNHESSCGKNTCIPPSKTPPPKTTQPCNVCPPCPAPCNPEEPPTAVEKELARLTVQMKTLEENYRAKLTECSVLRAEVGKRRDELEKERHIQREASAKLKVAEMQLENIAAHHNMMMGTKDQAAGVELNVRLLKQCYREAKEEIDELRMLLKEQNEQLLNYRNKYMQGLQQLEEQKRQMDNMDMDNNRISEQINLEIHRIKFNFQEKLAELTPMPELLAKTQEKLTEALQNQAFAEHKAERLSGELASCREQVHSLANKLMFSEEKEERPESQLTEVLQQRITQLTEGNQTLKNEIERLKMNVIRMEEMVLVNETRLGEKMQECVKLGGELDKTRIDTARIIDKVNERVETMRQTMQLSKTEMERELVSERAKLRVSEKNCQEIQCRMQCQIKRLRENYEQSQLRIHGLNAIVAQLRHGQPDHGDDDTSSVDECMCGVKLG